MKFATVAFAVFCVGGLRAYADGTNCVPQPAGLISWWPGNGDATGIADGKMAVCSAGPPSKSLQDKVW